MPPLRHAERCLLAHVFFSALLAALSFLAFDFFDALPALAIGIGAFLGLQIFRLAASSSEKVSAWAMPWTTIPLWLAWGYAWLTQEFGRVDYSAIIFHIVVGLEKHGASGATRTALLYSLGALATALLIAWMKRHDPRAIVLDRLFAVVLLVANPVIQSAASAHATQAYVEFRGLDTYLARTYRSPEVTPPASKKNLILLYAESLERSYQDPHYGDIYAPISRIAAEGTEFTGVGEVSHTHWTVAGMAATQCGIPTFIPRFLGTNSTENIDNFLPGVRCLGDILKDDGYALTFVGGAHLKFSGKGAFYKTHRFDRVLGFQDYGAAEKSRGYFNDWGLYDDTMFRQMLAEVRNAHDTKRPFAVVGLTLATHGPDGNPSAACANAHQGRTPTMLEIIRCSSDEIFAFYAQLKREGLLENTVFVLASDHLAFKQEMFRSLKAPVEARDNTLIVVAPDALPKKMHKLASTLDIFPTLLESLGYTVADRRAGLGYSLWGEQPTLYEQVGKSTLDQAIKYEGKLNRIVWTPPQPAIQR